MERTWKPTTGGILTIITGIMGITGGTLVIIASRWVYLLGTIDWSKWIQEWSGPWGPGAADIPNIIGDIVGISSTVLLIAGIVILVFGIIALAGGISALKRRRWGLSLAGAILSLPIMPVLGVLAIIFIALGRHEYE
jgi:hypothetical protein